MEGEEKRQAVKGMFSEIAPTYDLLNSLMSCRMHRRWRSAAVRRLSLSPGARALDLCCGTGDFLIPLRRAVGTEGTVAGLDFAEPMLRLAVPKVKAGLLLGDACLVPFASASFDAVTVGWGLRNVPDLNAAIGEAARVLRPGGRFACLDMTRSKGWAGWVSDKAFRFLVPLLGRLFGKPEAYAYLPKSTSRFVDAVELAQLLEAAGLTSVGFRKLYFGNVAMHWGTKR